MSGKARPNLRKSIPLKLELSNLSKTSKDCINEVFRRYENIVRVIEILEVETYERFCNEDYTKGYLAGIEFALEKLNYAIRSEANDE